MCLNRKRKVIKNTGISIVAIALTVIVALAAYILSKNPNEVLAGQDSIFENYIKSRNGMYHTNGYGRNIEYEKNISNPYETLTVYMQRSTLIVHPNGVSEYKENWRATEDTLINIELPVYMSIEEYVRNN